MEWKTVLTKLNFLTFAEVINYPRTHVALFLLTIRKTVLTFF
nr:MAG TPA: hypothetical protein [Caudoviricetes sp.]